MIWTTNTLVGLRLSVAGGVAGCLMLAGAAGCVVDNSGGSVGVGESLPGETTSYGDSGITGDGAASATPMLAKVDTNKTLNAVGGEGVGVFAEYDAGGHWNIWWTCDTSISYESCGFDINVKVNRGTISNSTSDGFAPTDQLTTSNVGTLEATTTTSTTVQGVHFDTEAGAVITLSAALGGAYSGSFLFFVQDGQIDGNYKGTLTDPLELEGSTP